MPVIPQIDLGLVANMAILAASSVLLLVPKDRRLNLLGLLGQYVWFATQMRYDIYRPVSLVRLGLGALICLLLYITAQHVEATSRGPRRPVEMNLLFRLTAASLAGLLTWIIWQRYRLPMVPEVLGIACYWLALDGLMVMLMSGEPLVMGLGLMTLVNAFEGVYLYNEQGLVATALVGVLDVAIALAIAMLAEMGIAGRERAAQESEALS